MSELKLCVFGPPRLERDGQPLEVSRRKALALLIYLAVTRQPHSRDALATLFWQDSDQREGRASLRRTLYRLNKELGEGQLSISPETISLDPQANLWLDSAAFHRHATAGLTPRHGGEQMTPEQLAHLAEAAALYTDDFMAGFTLPDCPAFDEWQFFQREELRQQLADVLQALITWNGARAAYGAAIEYARRWLALDPLHEPAHRELMRLYAWDGQHTAALRQYQECVRLLDAELGVEPESETTELYTIIKARRLAAPPVPAVPATIREPQQRDIHPATAAQQQRHIHHNLPSPPAGFVGRQHDIADIIRRLTDPACRLLTLTGPGGIGKTSLALRVGQILADAWAGEDELADGILFVPLSTVSTASGLASALAAAAHFDFYPDVSPIQQVLDYFHTRRMLLILDNFEHLRAEVGFVTALLNAAPGLRLLVTSREALNLQQEWFHPISGLAFPPTDDVTSLAQLAHYDAVHLFEQRARQVRSDFSLSRERTQVVRLCRLVEGMPLAIELATAWLKVLSVEQVVGKLEHGLDILIARDPNTPDRHRSMRAVLEQSWLLLSADEQRTLARLSVFCGGFSLEAAEAVAGASFAVLATFVEKSLLRSVDGRFQMHELLRQFAAEQLAADPQAAHTAHAQHSAYYLTFLAEREARLLGTEQQAAVAEIAQEIENVRTAWGWAIAHRDLALLDRALYSCFHYYLTRSYFQEGEEIFSLAAAITSDAGDPEAAALRARVRVRALIRRGAFRAFLGDYAAATRDAEHGQAASHLPGLASDGAFASLVLGMIAYAQGNSDVARRHFSAALEVGRAIDDQHIVADALHELAQLSCIGYGDYAEGKRMAQESLALSRASGRADWTAHALLKLAFAAACYGEYRHAEAYYRESLDLFAHIDNQYGVAMALDGLGWVAWSAGDANRQEARQLVEQGLQIVRELGHRLAVSNHLTSLALIAIDEEDYARAEEYSQEGLMLARQIGTMCYIVMHLCILGHVAMMRREFTVGRDYLSEALHNAAAARLWPFVASSLYYVAVLLQHEATCLPPNHPGSAQRRARALEMLTAVAQHPATWQAYRTRARRLADELRRELPAAAGAEAITRGQQFDWQAGVEPLLEELAQPAPTAS